MISNLPRLLYHQGLRFAETTAQLSKDEKGVFQPTSYKELSNRMMNFAAGLVAMGTKKGEHVGNISDNRQEWQIVSLGIMAAGGSDIPRGTDVTTKELAYILSFTECRTVCVENPFVLGKICEVKDQIPTLENVILVDDQNQSLEKYELGNLKLFHLRNILKEGQKWRDANPEKIEENILSIQEDETATIIFTSGTTGTPKGVELTHKNFLCQLEEVQQRLDFHKADRCMCILPIWHVYERIFEYYVMYFAGTLCYSKPVASLLLSDFIKVRPQFMPCVPRVWDALYQAISKKLKNDSKIYWFLFRFFAGCAKAKLNIHNILTDRKRTFRKIPVVIQGLAKVLVIPYGILYPLVILGDKLYFRRIKEMLGGQFICGISGGGGIPSHLDKFYNAIGIKVLEAYGLTETAPLVAMRHRYKPVLGTIGQPFGYNEVKIIKEDGTEAAPGEKGLLYIKGTNLMQGYYHQPELTKTVINEEGFFNTGDLAVKTYRGELMIKGRQKDTIVLRSGENVEPFPIEAKLEESPYIQQAIVVGQDENSLGALIIPNKEAIRTAAVQREIPHADNDNKLLACDFTQELIRREMERLICAKNGFKNFERVNQFIFLEKFENPKEELSAKGGIIRFKILQNYKHLINTMYHREIKKQKLADILQNLID